MLSRQEDYFKIHLGLVFVGTHTAMCTAGRGAFGVLWYCEAFLTGVSHNLNLRPVGGLVVFLCGMFWKEICLCTNPTRPHPRLQPFVPLWALSAGWLAGCLTGWIASGWTA